jgi:hypothetical protein
MKRKLCVAVTAGCLLLAGSSTGAHLITDNLFLHLEADVGVTEPGTPGDPLIWADQAALGGSNNAATALDGFIPTLVPNGSAMGNLPVIQFDGSDMLNISANSIFETNTLTWFLVLRTDAPPATQWVFGNAYTSLDGGTTNPDNFGTNHAWGTFTEATRYRNFARTTSGGIKNPFPSGHTATDEWFVLTGIWNGDLVKTTIIDSLGGVISNTISGANGNPAGHKISRIGADPQGGTLGFDGDYAALLVYDTNLSAPDEAAVQDYLYNKWIVPEPTTFALAVLGLVSVGLRRRRA